MELDYDNRKCANCGKPEGFVSNLPEYGQWLCFDCYINSIHLKDVAERIISHKQRYEELCHPL